MRQLLDVLERRSQGIIQHEMAAIAHVAAQQNLQGPPRSPTHTDVSRRHPHPVHEPIQVEQAPEPVVRHKHRGRPPTLPSPPRSLSPTPELPSSDSSSSSRESSPHKKKSKAKLKTIETRARPSPFVAEIANTKIPKALEKPPQLTIYTGKGDPDEHVDTFDLILDYRDATDNARCKLFPLSLGKSALKWYRELAPASIKSWSQFTQLFSARFTASRVKPKSADVLQGIKQGERETLREYLERYNQVAEEVQHLSDDIRVMFMRHGLRKGTLFRQEVGINKPRTMEEFMKKVQAYIEYEEAEAVTTTDVNSPKATSKDSKDRKKKDSSKKYRGRHSEYIDLSVTREKLLSECANTGFRNFKWPTPIPQSSHTNKREYCRYHRSNEHDTEECRVLKDDIEDLIKKGKLKQYLKGDEKKRDRSLKKWVNEVARSHSESSGDDSPRARRQRPSPTTMVIMGGYSMAVRLTKRSIKFHWQEVFTVGEGLSPESVKSNKPPLSFSDSDLYQGKANDEIPLIISAVMAGVDIRRVLVDQ